MAILAFFGTRLGLELLAGLALAAFAAAAYHHVWHNGYEDGVAEYAPVATACNQYLDARSPKACGTAITKAVADATQLRANNTMLTASVATANARADAFAATAARAKAAADAANKQADDDSVFYTERLKSLRNNLEHPAEDPNADADRILRNLAADSLPGH